MKKMLTLRKDELIVTVLLYLLVGIVMGIFMDAMASIDVEESNTVPNFVGIMVLVSLAMVGVIMHMVCFKSHFNLVIGMGVTRKEFLKQYFAISFIFLMGNLVIVYLVAFVEHLILSNIQFKVAVYEEIISSILFSTWMIVYVILTLAAEMFLSAALMRWGAKGFWIIYGVFMGGLFAFRTFAHNEIPGFLVAIVKFFCSVGTYGIVGMLIILAVGMMFGAMRLLMKQQVTA